MEEESVLHVEICQKANSTLSKEIIETAVDLQLKSMKKISFNVILHGEDFVKNTEDQTLKNENFGTHYIIKCHVESIICSGEESDISESYKPSLELKEYKVFKYYTYRLIDEDGATETLKSDSDELPVMSHWMLPAKEFHHMWENLYFEGNIQTDLLHYVETTMIFSDLAVNSSIISWNKLVLLYGPPGTGKTSMCKALAQKVAIRWQKRFQYGEFIEINSHSLFSKWFSESGKLVMKLFDEIKSMVQNENTFVCILIDEIESLAHSRDLFSNGTEPSDSIRVVNALLTQLDQIKRYPNVLILTTSNMTQGIDPAFVNRADVKQYLGYPLERTIYRIYHSCLMELMRVGILENETLDNIIEEAVVSFVHNFNPTKDMENHSGQLMSLCCKSRKFKLSGRILRKIPFLAHARLLPAEKKITLDKFLEAMRLTLLEHEESGNFTL